MLRILVIEDDEETLQQFRDGFPPKLHGHAIRWVFCPTFDEALDLVRGDRFDLIATDIYRDRKGVAKENLTDRDQEARNILNELRGRRFTPAVIFSDSTLPPSFELGPFVLFADKASGDRQLLEAIGAIIDSGIPDATRHLHDEVDRIGGEYLWGFLKDRWAELQSSPLADPEELERIVRRRIATTFALTDPKDATNERSEVDALDYYIYPRISTKELRLGDVVVRRADQRIGLVLTPHCHLAIQGTAGSPRVDAALVAWARPTADLLTQDQFNMRDNKREAEARKKFQSPADLGSPNGRYWFLPPFLDIPPLYCDLIDLENVAIVELTDPETTTLLATLDAPFAEALQSCFLRLFSAVGLPSLRLGPLMRLVPSSPEAKATPSVEGPVG
jgi:CheY-like chemotaxis protein